MKALLVPLFGEKIELRIVDPRSLVLLKVNAHFMPKAMFDNLAENVAEDGFLASIPLCHTLPNDRLEVLSGNHRVQGAIEAKLTRIVILVIPYTLPKSKKTAVQLSHNSIVGTDDKQILATLWADITDLKDKVYSGLDSRLVGELTSCEFSAFRSAAPKTERITLWCVPDEVTDIDALLGEAKDALASDVIYLVPIDRYEKLFKLLTATKARENIKNTAVAFMWLIDKMKDHIDQMLAEHAAAKASETVQAGEPAEAPEEPCQTTSR
jgi:hypothetical protein